MTLAERDSIRHPGREGAAAPPRAVGQQGELNFLSSVKIGCGNMTRFQLVEPQKKVSWG